MGTCRKQRSDQRNGPELQSKRRHFDQSDFTHTQTHGRTQASSQRERKKKQKKNWKKCEKGLNHRQTGMWGPFYENTNQGLVSQNSTFVH